MHHKKNKTVKALSNLLQECFGYYRYKKCIVLTKHALLEPQYLEHWEHIKQLIDKRKLETGIPLDLIHNAANLPLDENSDEAAYKWLDLFVRNVETTSDDDVVEY
jgi:hypothetical protein